MSEFVKNGLYFAMREERWLVANGGSQIATDKTKVWRAWARRGIAITSEQIIHPGAATF